MAIEVKRFLEEGRIVGEKESVLPSVGEERIRGGGGAYTLRNDTKEELLREHDTLRNDAEEELLRDVDPYIMRVGIERRKRGGRKFRKG